MNDVIRKAAWFSLFTNVLLFVFLLTGVAPDSALNQILRVAMAPGLAASLSSPDHLFGIALMVMANWVVWIALWWLVLAAVREVRGSPAW